MRVGVYQRNVATFGGGERYTLDFARFFAHRGHDVDLIAPPETTLEELGARLGADVDGLRFRAIDLERPEGAAAEASEDYDVFVNATYASGTANRARRGVYVVHFPHRPSVDDLLAEAELPARNGRRASRAWVRHWAGGWRAPNRGWWTGPNIVLGVSRHGPGRFELELELERGSGTWSDSPVALIRFDGKPFDKVRLPRRRTRVVRVPIPSARAQFDHTVEVQAPVARIEQYTGRPLGVHIRGLRFRGLPDARSEHGHPPLHSYDQLVANSAYSARWAREYWGAECAVAHPAVPPLEVPAGIEKTNSIVVLGRFFSGNHSKRQVELVRAFRRMCDAGLDGWTLHLVGGSDPLHGHGYVDRVRALAAGYPVEVHENAPRAELVEVVGRARIAWQASGWGEDPEKHPERFEHFGIALVEVMSAATVPVALATGGAAEIVRDGIDGLLWTEGPEAATRALIEDPARLARLSAAARERAGHFARSAFEAEAERAFAPLFEQLR